MDGNETTKLGRRALLAAGAAGVAAAAAQAVAPGRVLAADGWEMKIGETNLGNHTTVLKTSGAHGFHSECDVGDGLRGLSDGASNSGVYGRSSHADGFGVYGRNSATGAFGYLGGDKATGVYGSIEGSDAWGALGGSGDHSGMSDSPGVYAFGRLGKATAMVVDGQAKFLTAGRMTIPAGKSAATVSSVIWGGGPLPLELLPNCLVLATLQTNKAGLYVQSAVPNISKGTITVYLNKKVTAATKVAWFVLNFGAP
jgi:hypothetical protein